MMNGPRGHRFAGAAFAENENGRLRVGDAFNQVEQASHLEIVADDASQSVALVKLLAQRFVFFDDLPLIEGTLKQPRLLSGAPRAVGAAELDWILRDAMQYW